MKKNSYILEPIKERHADILFDLLQSKLLYEFIPQKPPNSIEELKRKFIFWDKGNIEEPEEIWLNYAIFDSEKYIYLGLLQATISKKEKSATIAYQIFPKFWKLGIAKQTCSLLIEHIINTYQLCFIDAYIDTRNIASINLIKSLGFKYKKEIKNADFFKGEKSDEFVFELNLNN